MIKKDELLEMLDLDDLCIIPWPIAQSCLDCKCAIVINRPSVPPLYACAEEHMPDGLGVEEQDGCSNKQVCS